MMPWEDLPEWARNGLAFTIALLVTLAVTPVVAKLARRTGLIDAPGGHKAHAIATPYLGGLAIAVGLLVAALIFAGRRDQLIVIILGAGVLGLVGLIDDVQPLAPWIRLSCEIAAALALWVAGIRAGVFNIEGIDLVLTVLWVVAVTNAYNFIDNMDGIASGVAAAAAVGIAAIASHNGDFLVTSLALAVAGAAIGFLRYNFPPARIFLGDGGSMLLGFLVAALILQIDLPVAPWPPRVLSTVLLAGVPLFDLTVVVVARLRDGRRIWLGSTDHTSHRLAAGGRSRRHVLVVSIAAQLACSGLAYLVYRQPETTVYAVGAVIVVIWLLALWMFLRMPGLVDAIDPEIDAAASASG
jgi:UDP-GlcNAc:undecaprenyl-phosphate/decaprenyl-phosphate GlcNAc-1-phosphate transferase